MSDSLHIVTIDNIYRNIDNDHVRGLMNQLFLMRAKGFGPDHSPYLLPYDPTDFIGRHHLFCIQKEGKMIPIGGFKHVSLFKSDAYHLQLPILSVAYAAKSEAHVKSLEELFALHRGAKKDLFYGGSFTINKAFRGASGYSHEIRELVAALVYSDMMEFGVETCIGVAAIRFKTDALFESMGYQKMKYQNKELPVFEMIHAQNDPVVLIQLERPSQWTYDSFKKHLSKIQQRIFYPDLSHVLLKVA